MDHLLFEEVSNKDKAKKVIATSIAQSYLNNEVPDARAETCYNALPVCDQLDIDNHARFIVRAHKSFDRVSLGYNIKGAIITIIIFALLVILCFAVL